MRWTKSKRAGYFFLSLLTVILFLYLSAAWVIHKALENGRLHEWLSESLGNNIDYDVVDVLWSMGTASVELKQVEVFHDDEVILNIPELALHVDVLHSLFHMKLIFDRIDIKNLVLKLRKTVSGVRVVQSDQVMLAWQELWPWIEPQKKIVIHDAKILSDQDFIWVEQFNLDWHRTLLNTIQIKASARVGSQDGELMKLAGGIKASELGPVIALQLDTPEIHFDWNDQTLDLSGRADLLMSHAGGSATKIHGAVSLHPKGHIARDTEKFEWGWNASWHFNADSVVAENSTLQFYNPWIQANLGGSFRWDLNELMDPLLQLKGEIHLKEFHQVLPLLSVLRPTNPKLMDWLLHNIVKIPEAHATLEWQGHLLQYPMGQKNPSEFFNLSGHFKEASFYPENAWPLVESASPDIQIHNDSLILTATEVHSLGIVGNQVSLDLPDWTNDLAIMLIKVQSSSPAEDLRAYLLKTPLHLSLFNYLRLQGPVQTTLILEDPLDPRPIQAKAHVALLGDRLWLDSNQTLVVQNIRGEFDLVDDQIQTDHPIVGSLFDQPIQGSFTQLGPQQGGGNRLEVMGRMPISPFVSSWIGLGFSQLIQGEAPFHLVYTRYPKSWELHSEFDLTSAFISPPKPYSPYSFQDILYIHAEEKAENLVSIDASLADFMKASIQLDSKLEFVRPSGAIQILTHQEIKSDKIEVSLHLPDFTDNSLLWLIAQLKESAATQDFLKFNIEIDRAEVYGQLFNQLHAKFDSESNGSQLFIDHDRLKGTAFFPDNALDPMQINIQHMDWSTREGAGHFEVDPDFYPGSIPAMNLEIDDLFLDSRPLGSVVAHTKKQEGGILFQEIKWKQSEFEAVIMGDWVRAGPEIKNSILGLSGRISSRSWQSFLKALGYEHPAFKANAGQIDFVLTWAGAPYQFDLKKSTGSISFDLSGGALLGVNPLISRFIDLMNIGSLNTRFQLSGSNIKGDDLIFDRFKGQYTIESGVLKTHNANLTGPTMDLTLIGSIDMNDKTLDQRIRVKPHLGSSMALVAGVLGGPVVGVATWVANKIVGSTLLKDQAMIYRLKGSWDNYNLYPLGTE